MEFRLIRLYTVAASKREKATRKNANDGKKNFIFEIRKS